MSIATEISRLQQAKIDLETAIEAKGVDVPAGTLIDAYAALVGNISGSSVLTGDAAVGDVLSGKTFYSNDPASKQTGTMPDRSGDTACVSSSIDGTTLKLLASEGYRDGVNDTVSLTDADFVAANIKNGVNVFGLAGNYAGLDTSDATAVAGDLLYNKTAYVNGAKITGLGAYWQYALSMAAMFNTASLPSSMIIYAPNCTNAGDAFDSSTGLVTLDLTLSASATRLYQMCLGCASMTTVYLRSSTAAVTDMRQMFSSCTNLVTVNGTISFASCSSNAIDAVFQACPALVNVTVAQNSTKINMSFSASPLLSSASLISIANGLDAAAAPKTLTMHATSKTNMNNLMVDNNAGVAVAGTAMTLTAFITNIKGWTVA